MLVEIINISRSSKIDPKYDLSKVEPIIDELFWKTKYLSSLNTINVYMDLLHIASKFGDYFGTCTIEMTQTLDENYLSMNITGRVVLDNIPETVVKKTLFKYKKYTCMLFDRWLIVRQKIPVEFTNLISRLNKELSAINIGAEITHLTVTSNNSSVNDIDIDYVKDKAYYHILYQSSSNDVSISKMIGHNDNYYTDSINSSLKKIIKTY